MNYFISHVFDIAKISFLHQKSMRSIIFILPVMYLGNLYMRYEFHKYSINGYSENIWKLLISYHT